MGLDVGDYLFLGGGAQLGKAGIAGVTLIGARSDVAGGGGAVNDAGRSLDVAFLDEEAAAGAGTGLAG